MVCKANYISQVYLKEHMKNMHKDMNHSNNTDSNKLDCKKCGRILETEREADTHVRNCKEAFTVNKKECRYFKRGSCRKGEFCKFSHTKPKECRNGVTCRYLAQGRCKFEHQTISPGNQNRRENSGAFGYCLFGSQCRNLPYCPLVHYYNMDFPHLPASRNHPMEARGNARNPRGRF